MHVQVQEVVIILNSFWIYSSIQDIIVTAKERLCGEFTLVVRRSHFLEDVLMQMESVQYDPTKELKVSNHTQTPKHSYTHTHTCSNQYAHTYTHTRTHTHKHVSFSGYILGRKWNR